jgi:hypothetical protein
VTHGAASSSAFPDAGAIEAAMPIIVATETSKKAIHLIVAPLKCDFYTSFAASDRNPSRSMLSTPKRSQCRATLDSAWKSKRIARIAIQQVAKGCGGVQRISLRVPKPHDMNVV